MQSVSGSVVTHLSKFHVMISEIPVLDLRSEKTLRLFFRVEGVLYPFERVRSCQLHWMRRGTRGRHFGTTHGWL